MKVICSFSPQGSAVEDGAVGQEYQMSCQEGHLGAALSSGAKNDRTVLTRK